MASTYYDSQLTGAEIEAALNAVSGLIVPANNGKIIAVENGSLVAKSATEYQDVTLGSKTIAANGTYYSVNDNLTGYNEVIVNVPSSGSISPVSVDYSDNAGMYILTNNKLRVNTTSDQNYKSIAINISQHNGHLLRIQNTNGNVNVYGLYSSLTNAQEIKFFGKYLVCSSGDLVIHIDNNMINDSGYLVYFYTANSQSAPTVTAYSISFS